MKNTFRKVERLKSQKAIAELFEQGLGKKAYPLAVRFLEKHHADGINRAGFSVPKKSFKRAVDRNRIKRLMREAYRLNKLLLIEQDFQGASMIFIYLPKHAMPFSAVQEGMKQLLIMMGNQRD